MQDAQVKKITANLSHMSDYLFTAVPEKQIIFFIWPDLSHMSDYLFKSYFLFYLI